jgi:hypothetical protein
MTENIVSLPDALWAIANERATESGCANVSEYLTRLIDQDRLAHARNKFDGSPIQAPETAPEDRHNMREEVANGTATHATSERFVASPELEALLIARIEDPERIVVNDEDWARIRQEAERRLRASKAV